MFLKNKKKKGAAQYLSVPANKTCYEQFLHKILKMKKDLYQHLKFC